jgi:hypothetical protein
MENPASSMSSYRGFDIFEHAPRLRNLSLGRRIPHLSVKIQIPWHQLTELDAHVRTTIECLETLQLVPNLVKFTVYSPSLYQKVSIRPHNIPFLTLAHLRYLRYR